MGKRFAVSILLVLFLSTWASAESSVWRVQKGTSVLYLGGTCHVLRESDYPLPPEFESAYRASAALVFETDIGKLQDPAVQQKLLAKSLYSDGSTIDMHLSARAYRVLSDYCRANGIPLELLARFKPSMLMVTLATLELVKLGITQEGVDQHFYALAKKEGKAVEGLETADEQINYVVSMADGFEDDFVIYSVSDMKNLNEQFTDLAKAWRSGDTGTLDRLMNDDLKSRWPGLYGKLITNRNRNWMPLIEAYLKTPRIEFILVGAGHLVGPDGIVELLRKKGYTVKKI